MENPWHSMVAGIAVSILWPTALLAYDIETHRQVGLKSAAVSSRFNSVLTEDLGYTNGKGTPFQDGGLTLTAEAWIGEGAAQEDQPSFRVLNHFHDPTQPWDSAGLRFLGLTLGQSSVRWQQDPRQEGSGGGLWSWPYARQRFLDALTATTRTDRDQHFARTLRALGQAAHLVQDATVPAHVRNDPHLSIPLPNGRIPLDPDWYEDWIQDLRTNNTTDFQALLNLAPAQPLPSVFGPTNDAVAPAPVAGLIDTSGLRLTGGAGSVVGVAEFASANFLSRDSIFAGFALPSFASLGSGFSDVEGTTVRTYHSKLAQNGSDVAVQHFVTEGPWCGLLQQLTGTLQRICLTLSPLVHRDYASLLLPGAVGSSAALLNYFFRGQFSADRVTPPAPTQTAFALKNLTPDESFSGTVGIYYDNAAGQRVPVPDLSPSTVDLPSTGAPQTVSFAPPGSDNPTGTYVIVLSGTLGNEAPDPSNPDSNPGAIMARVTSVGLVEELFIATAPGAPADVYFRNDQQVTPLNLRAQLPAWALADGADLMYVRWGTRSDSFFVKTAKFVPGDFVTGSAPDIMNEAYHVFTFARPALDVPLGGTPPAPTVVSSVRLDDAQIPTGVTIDYDFRTSNGGETQHLAGQLSPMFDATVWRGSGVNWGRALRVADVQLDDNLALQALLAIHEWDLFRAAAQQQGNTLLADSGPPLAGGDQLFLVDLSQQRVVWKSARDVISYRSELTITDVDDGQNQSITWVETESFTTYTDAVLQALGVPIDTTQWQTPKQTVETGPHFSDVRTFATSTLSLRLGGVYRPRRALAPGDTTLGSVVLTAVVNYDYVGSPFVVQVDGDSVVQSGNPARAAVRVVLYDVASDAPRLTLLSDGSHDRYAPSAQDTAIHFEDLGYPHTTFTQAVRYPDVTVLADGGDYVGLLYRQGQDDAGDFESQTGIPSPDDDRVLPPGRLFVVLASTGLNASTLAFQQTELVTDNGGYTDPPQGTAVLAFPLAALRPNFLYHGAATEQYFVNPLDAGGQLALTLDGVSARESTALSRDKAALLAVPAGLTVRTAAPDPVNDDEYQFGPSQHVINNSTLVGSSFVDDI